MELSERYISILESEGFTNIYEWQDPAGKVYPTHAHKGKTSIMLTDGSATFVINGAEKEVSAPQRVDIPADTPHSVTVGPEGWIVIIGEEIEEAG